MKQFCWLFLVVLLFAGCKKSNPDDTPEHFLFCYYGGWCGFGCSTIFEIKNQKLYTDSTAISSGDRVFLNKSTLSNSQYLVAKPLQDNLPRYLLDHPNQTFGSPNVDDSLGFYLELVKNGQKTHWYIDTDLSNLPPELQGYGAQIQAVIMQL